MEELDARKAIGPDGVSGCILKLSVNKKWPSIHYIIECSFKIGKVPKEWIRADIIMLI